MKPTSIRIDEATLASIDGMAQALGRSRAWIIQDALAKYLTHETWFHEEVRKGQADLAAGRAVAHEDVLDRLTALGVDIDRAAR